MKRADTLAELAATATDECVLWPYALSEGYPRVYVDGVTRHGHRVVCEWTHGLPEPGQYAIHSCDTPACVNARHLRWASPTENVADMHQRDRHQYGATHWKARLTEDDVREIRRTTTSATEMALRFGVRADTIHHIRAGRGWAGVT